MVQETTYILIAAVVLIGIPFLLLLNKVLLGKFHPRNVLNQYREGRDEVEESE